MAIVSVSTVSTCVSGLWIYLIMSQSSNYSPLVCICFTAAALLPVQCAYFLFIIFILFYVFCVF